MGTRYNRRDRGTNGTVAFFLSAILFLAVGAVAVWAVGSMHDRADMDRAQVLRVEHGDLCNRLSSLSEQSSEGDRLRKRLREVVGAHNAILTQHPTWTLAPLDSRCAYAR